MINLIPSINIKYGKVVRLNSYNANDVVVYNVDPLDWAMELEDHGVKRIIVLDVDGIEKRKLQNLHALEKITGFTELEVNYGGGVHTEGDVRAVLEAGAKKVCISSTALSRKETFLSWMVTFGQSKLLLSIDVNDGKIIYRENNKVMQADLHEALTYFYENGLQEIKCAVFDEKDHQQQTYKALTQTYPDLKFIIRPNIQGIHEVKEYESAGFSGIVFSKALLENKISLLDLKHYFRGQD